MGIVVGARYISEIAFGDQAAGDDRGRSNESLFCVASEVKWILVGVYVDAVGNKFLTDVSGDDVGVVSTFF